MTTQQRLLDLDDFLALPEEKPYLELIDGEVCQKPVGKEKHANAQSNLLFLLRSHRATRGGRAYTELGMHFWYPGTRRNHRVPDVSYFRPGRARPTGPYPEQPPDLVAEVLSPGQSHTLLRDRLAFLRGHGVAVTLLIDPEAETVEVTEGTRTWTVRANETVTIDSLDGFGFEARELLA